MQAPSAFECTWEHQHDAITQVEACELPMLISRYERGCAFKRGYEPSPLRRDSFNLTSGEILP